MKPKTTLILFVILIGAGVFYWLWGIQSKEKRERKQEMAQRIIPVEEEQVNRVALFREGDSSVVYQREEDTWEITYPVRTGANTSNVESNLSAFLEAEKTRILTEESTDLTPYGLANPGSEAHIYYADTGKAEMLIGEENPTQSGIFAKLGDSPTVYLTNSNIQTQAVKTLFDLRDRSIVTFDRNTISKIIMEKQDGSVLELNKVNGNWRMAEPQIKVTQSEVNSILSSIQNGQAQQYYEEMAMNLDDYGLQNPNITVSFFSNDTTRAAALVFGDPIDDSDSPQYYAKDMTRPMVFSVNNNVYSNVDQEPFEFQDKDVFDVSRNQISDVTIHWSDTIYTLSKIDTAWQITGPIQELANDERVNEILDQINALRLDEPGSYENTSLSLYGLTDPWMEIEFKVGGSDLNGISVGSATGEGMRYIKTHSSPYIYKIQIGKLEEFQVTLDDLIKSTSADSVAVQ